MSFVLDPFLAFSLGLVFSIFTKKLNIGKKTTFIICTIAISLATLYSVLLYLNIVHSDFLILDNFAKFLPIEHQFGPRIMLHSNETQVTKDSFPQFIIIIFYALYFLWFYLGFKSASNVLSTGSKLNKNIEPVIPYIRIGGLFIFVIAGLMLLFFVMIPLDKVLIGDVLGAKSNQNQEEVVKSYMKSPNAKFNHFSDQLCNPQKLGIEENPPMIVNKDTNIKILSNEISSISVNDLRNMCDVRENLANSVIFFFIVVSTWIFLIGVYIITIQSHDMNILKKEE